MKYYRTLWATIALAVGVLLGVSSSVSAAVYTYDLSDARDGALGSWGITTGDLFDERRSFSFDTNGASATLVYDDVAGTALITGQVTRNKGNGRFGRYHWDLSYSLSGLTDLGNGAFEDFAGLGSGVLTRWDGETYDMFAKANRDGFFSYLDDEGNGAAWFNPPGAMRTNDFDFNADLISAVPLPAGGLLLLSGLGLMALRRRR